MQGRRARVSLASLLALTAALAGCGRRPAVSVDGLPLTRVVVYRNGVAYFERAGHVEDEEVRFKVKESEVGDFLATLAIMEKGGSSVRSAAFPLKVDDEEDDGSPPARKTPDEKRGLKHVVLSLDGKAHDLEVGYVVESPVWRPSYRLVVEKDGQAYLQAWGIVQNLSGEDWKNVRLSLVAGAPLAFEAQLGASIIPQRPVVTDQGEVITAVPRGDTSLRQEPPDTDADGIADEADADDGDMEELEAVAKDKKERRRAPEGKADRAASRAGSASGARPSSPAPAQKAPPRSVGRPPPPPPRAEPAPTQAPRNLRSLAAVAVEAGTTRYDLPQAVTIPDKSATMVMLLARRVPGEALFLFAPDGGVPDSASHPFRVARFSNATVGVLERGPIAVFEKGSFLGQGMLDPLPAGATATVPFALERAIAVDRDQKRDELGERIAKIENAQLTIERDSVLQTKYRLRNGADVEAKMLVRHPRLDGARLHQPPSGTEDNVGTQTALVPGKVRARATTELTVDERSTLRRVEDWFSPIADNAVKAYLQDPRADRAVAAKLTAAWAIRKEVVDKLEARVKLAHEQATLGQQTQETRSNLRAIEKNKAATQLRARLEARLSQTATRLDEITKQIVEIDSKLAELRIQFKEIIFDLKVSAPLPPR
jgi:hypothetical protein